MIHPINNLDKAIAEVRKAKTKEDRWILIDKYMSGQPDPTTDAGRDLLHRRALFCTAIRKFWPDEDAPDEAGALALV